jgi:excisionase family DNA binding protein
MADSTSDDANSGQGTIPDSFPVSGILNARKAADTLQVNERTIRRAIASGQLDAAKVGRAFQITPAALASYQERLRRRHVGRTPTPVESERTQDRPVLHLVDPIRGPAFTIPRPLTSFCGREREVEAIAALLTQPAD